MSAGQATTAWHPRIRREMAVEPSRMTPPVQALALRDFLLPMLNFNPRKRASAAQMLQHPWLAQ